jgi:hypothetical protein
VNLDELGEQALSVERIMRLKKRQEEGVACCECEWLIHILRDLQSEEREETRFSMSHLTFLIGH